MLLPLSGAPVSKCDHWLIVGHPPGLFPHVPSAVAALAMAANRPDWVNLKDVDVPIRQHSLLVAIDEAIYAHLLSTAPDTCSRALTRIVHAGDWLNVVPSAPLGLHIHDEEFHCSLRYWLGVGPSLWEYVSLS